MPNWVQNQIIFDNPAVARRIAAELKTDTSEFDFNTLIPMPESLDIKAGASTDRAIAYYVTERLTIPVEQTNLKDLIHNFFSDDWAAEVVSRIKKDIDEGGTEDWDKVYEAGRQYMHNREHYGHYTWYDWRLANWGTKWNASEVFWDLDGGILTFQTAWSAPFPIVEALAQKYPDLELTHCWADEDIGNNCGQTYYSGGQGCELSVVNARAFALEVWGYEGDENYEYEADIDDEDDIDTNNDAKQEIATINYDDLFD